MDKKPFKNKELKETLYSLIQPLADMLEARAAMLCLLDSLNKTLEVIAYSGLALNCLKRGEFLSPEGMEVLLQNKLLIISDTASDSCFRPSEEACSEGLVSVIATPFSIDENTQMAIFFAFDRQPLLESSDRRFLHYVSRQNAVTIKNAIDQVRYQEIFRKVSTAIHEGESAGDILDRIVTHIHEVTEARGCIYWIVDTSKRRIHMKATSGFHMESLSAINYDTLLEIFKFDEEKDVLFEDIRTDNRIPSATHLGKQMVISILGIPFAIVDQYKGILAVYFSQKYRPPEGEREFVRALGRQGAIALHKAFRYDDRLLNTFRETIEGLVLTLEAKDVCTHGHSINVANYSFLTAREMGMSPTEANTIYHAGLLHDIGKIAMQDTILENLGKLSPNGFEIVKKHPAIGARILGPLSSLSDVTPLILYHHERYNGSGYPEGLAGEEIPLGARIIAVSDAFDAMTSQRPGNNPVSIREALNQIRQQSGTFFDPRVVRAFVNAIEQNPEEVNPFIMARDYFSKNAYELNLPERRGSSWSRLLRKWILGF